MDAEQLFWATGIDNTKLNTNANEAVAIFKKLSDSVKVELDKIERYYDKVQQKANLKFTNPVDPSMVASIREQMSSLGKVIDDQTNRVANLSMTYDKAMSKINSAASRLGKGGRTSSPIKESVDNVKADVVRADRELTFLESRFKYAASSLIAYGSFRWGQQFIADIIKVKGEFDQLRVAIDSFTGSAEKGAQVFGQLTRLAVKSPFELKDITNSAKQLLAYGTAADDVAHSVQMLSDVSAGSGQSIKDIAYLYGTSLTQGRLYTRDLFQFANRGIPIYGELAKVMGISTRQLMEQVKIGKVGFPELQKAIENMTAAGGKYYGLSDKLAETTYGKISNLKDKWSIALNEMGTQTDGIVSAAVEGITKLIVNWENVVKAIEGVILAYGSYKAATAVGALVAGAESYASNYREAEALNILTTTQQRADLEKKGFVLGSVEYTAAIKAEAAAQLENAEKALLAAEIEVKANQELLLSKQQLSISLGEEVVVRKAALDAAKLNGTIAEIETAQTELNTASKNRNIAIEESRTIAKKLNAAETEKQIIAGKVELITTVQDTAAKAANAGTTNLLTLAKIKLTAVAARLNAVIAANPWTAAAVAIGVLVYAVWQFHDSTTAAEKAQKKLGDTLDAVQQKFEARVKGFNDRLNIIKQEAAADATKIKAYNELKILYKDIIGDMTMEQLIKSNSVELQKKNNTEAEKGRLISLKKNKEAAEAALQAEKTQMRNAYKNVQLRAPNISFEKFSEYYQKNSEAYKNAQIYLQKITNEYNSYNKAQKEAIEIGKEPVVKNKEYWEGIRDSARTGREALDKSKGNAKEWNRLLAIERNAEKELGAWDSSKKLDSAAEKAQKERERKAKEIQEQNKLNNEILQNQEKLADASKQAELDRAQAVIDAMEDGYAKKQAQIEANYNKEIAKIKEKGDELLKIQQKIAYNQWLIANPDWKKKKKTFAMPTTLSTENQSTIESLTGTAEMNKANESKKMYENLLIDLQNFDQQRTEIDKKYNDQVKFLTKQRTEANKEQTDKAIEEAGRLAKEAKAKISLEELQKDINWGDVFSDLNKISTDSLRDIRDKIKKFVKDFNGDLSKVDTKEIVKALEDMDKKISERSPFSSLSEGIKMYEDSSKRIKDAQDKVNKLSLGKGEVATKALAEATDELTRAQNDNAASKAKMTNAIHSIADSGKQLLSAGYDITSTMETLGIKVPESLKGAMQGVGTVLDGLSEMDRDKPMTMITGSIKALRGYAEVLASLFGGSKGTANYEKLKASLESYMDVLDRVIDKQKEMMDGLVGTAALTAQKELEKTINKRIESYRKLAELAGKAGASIGSHSYAYRTNKELKGSWADISKSAGQTIDSIDDLYSLSSEQLQRIMTENPLAWSKINSEIRGYLESIIEAGDSIKESIEDANEAFLGLSLDSAKDSLDDLMKDTKTTFADVADNFEDYMRTAMLNIVKSKYLTEALTGWYSDFVDKTKSGNELTQTEVDQLRQAYLDIYKNAQSQYDALLDAADVQLTSSQNSTSGAISSMSQESADILTAQFSAIRINVSDILLTLQSERPLLELAFNDIAEIARNTRDLADIKRLLGDIKDYGIKMK